MSGYDGLMLSTNGINAAKDIISAVSEEMLPVPEWDLPSGSDEEYGPAYATSVYRAWRGLGRQVLSMHPGLVDECRMATSAKVVPEVWRTLPYINPMVVFAEPVPLRSWSPGESMTVLGFINTGRSIKDVTDGDRKGRMIEFRATHDPNSEVLAFFVVMRVTDTETGVFKGYEFNRISVPMSGPEKTLDEIVDSTLSNFAWSDQTARCWSNEELQRKDLDDLAAPDRPTKQEWMRKLLQLVIGTEMYLCSTTVDAQVVPKSRVRKLFADQKQAKHVNLINVGWTIGPALSKLRRAARDKRPSDMPGRTVQPHQRRAHFAIRWTGKGRAIPKLVFIAPTWVHADLMHLVDTKTVRAVR